MKKVFLLLFALGLFTTTLTSCRDQEDAGDKIEDAADDVGDAVD